MLHISASITMRQKIGPCAVVLSLIRIIKADLLSLCSGYISVKIYVARKKQTFNQAQHGKSLERARLEYQYFFT